jgi:hypothetical protein
VRGPSDKAGFWWAILLALIAAAACVSGWSLGWSTASTNGVFLAAVLAIVALLLVVEAIARWVGVSFLGFVALGEDGRTSTSKTFVFMWTMLVGWALVALLFAGNFLPIHGCVNEKDAKCAGDAVGFLQLGWRSFVQSGLDTAYLVLLGIPAGAAVAAKAVTESKLASNSLPKTPLSDADQRPAARVMQIFSADDGSTDLGDFQYTLFNLILAAYFISGLVSLASLGLPKIPDTLLGLTSVSAALYVGKKLATRVQPAITAVIPSLLVSGQGITIIGTDLTDDPTLTVRQSPRVMINGVEAVATSDGSVADQIAAIVPAGLNPTNAPIDGTVEVLSSYRYKTAPFAVKVKGQ